MFKVLLWDIDGTVLNFLKAESYAIKYCFNKLKVCDCTDEIVKRYSQINIKHWKMLERGEINKKQVMNGRFVELFNEYNIDFTDLDALNAEYQIRLGDKIFFNDNAFELITDLSHNYKQYAVTNGTFEAQDRKLRRSHLIDVLDGVFISDIIGYQKPSKEFFEKVLKQIEPCDKSEILIIGDSLTSDILGANNAGIKCCWYNPSHEINDKNLKIDYEISNLNQLRDILK